MMWYLVDPNAVAEVARFVTIGTGYPLAENADKYEYLGTFLDLQDQFVGHLFRMPVE